MLKYKEKGAVQIFLDCPFVFESISFIDQKEASL
jgi:hypothetical protein